MSSVYRPGIYPKRFPGFINRSIYGVLTLIIRLKWINDSAALPLRQEDWELYLDIHIVSALRLHKFPNLINPAGYNDQMKWLMLFSQHELMPQCADKFRVRSYVGEKIGEEFLIPLKAVGDSWGEIESSVLQGPGAIKCTHDSGSTVLFEELDESDLERLRQRFERQLLRRHGSGKGEWHYRWIKPRLLVEEKLPGSSPRVGPADVKIHCVGGNPRLIHIIEDRQANSRQAFFSAEGAPVEVAIKPHRGKVADFDFEKVRGTILPLAARLAEPFRYVRVDFYLVGDTPFFGELTFFEEAGLFLNRLEDESLARAIGLECRDPIPTIHNALPKAS